MNAPIPRAEHPRPDFMRDTFVNLNGEWQFAFDDDDAGLRAGWQKPGTALPLLYGFAALAACYLYISWVDRRKLPTSIARLKAPWKAAAFAAVWLATIAIIACVYPRITEYATIWNGYLWG